MLDYLPGQTLSERAVSAFPVSIGTSLALESIFEGQMSPYDPERVIPNHIDILRYQEIWINISTLFRNLVGAVTKEAFLGASSGVLASTLEEEIEVITNLFQNEGKGFCRPIFYHSDYSRIKSKNLPAVAFREPSSEAQKYYHLRLQDTLKLMDEHTDSIRRFHDAIEASSSVRAIVLTHCPYDLVKYRQFKDLELLESNTGLLKPRSQWSSKYYPVPGASMVQLPFHKKLLLVMGDKVLLKPGPLSLRKQIIDTSIKHNWSPLTTMDKVNLDLSVDIKDPYTMAILNAL